MRLSEVCIGLSLTIRMLNNNFLSLFNGIEVVPDEYPINCGWLEFGLDLPWNHIVNCKRQPIITCNSSVYNGVQFQFPCNYGSSMYTCQVDNPTKEFTISG